MKKKVYLSTAVLIILILVSACVFSASQKTTKYTLTAPYTINMSMGNGDVYCIKRPDLKDRSNTDYYNLDKLDRFIENSLKGEKEKIRVIKYEKNDYEYSLEWMYDIQYDGNRYKLDIYANDSIVDNKYNAVFTNLYDKFSKTGDNSYILYNNSDDNFSIF